MVVESRRKQSVKQKLQIERHLESVDETTEEFETNYKKPTKGKADISDFLD
jgi:hypothetical protein